MKHAVMIEDKVFKRLADMAEGRAGSVEALTDEALRHYIEYREWLEAQVKEGIEEADRGDFASEGEVKALFAEWGVKSDEDEVDTPSSRESSFGL